MATIGELMGQRQCEVCKEWFTPKEEWHKRCSNCVGKGRPKDDKSSSSAVVATGRRSNLRAEFESYLDDLSENGYFDQKNNLRPEFVVRDADVAAHYLADAGVTNGQLRRFFTMSRSLEHHLNILKDFDAIKPEIAKLHPFAAAIIGREQIDYKRRNLLALLEFIKVNAQRAMESEHSFRKGFLEHFECVMAWT
jgi:hypothetical protein